MTSNLAARGAARLEEVRARRASRVSRITAEYRGLKRTSKGLVSAVSLVASLDGPAIATTARRERGLAAMLLLRVDLPRAVPATATRAEREDAMTVDMLADVMVRGRRMPVCVGGAASAVVTAVASVRQTVGREPREAGRRQGAL